MVLLIVKTLLGRAEYTYISGAHCSYSVISSERKSHFDSTFMSVLLNGTMYVVRVDLASNRVGFVPGTQVFVYQFS